MVVFVCAEAKGLEFNDVLLWNYFKGSINRDNGFDWLYIYSDYLKVTASEA